MTELKRISLIGVGMVGQTHVDAIAATPGVTLGGVCARRVENARTFADQNGGLPVIADVFDITKANTDIAIVATPPNARQEIVAHLCAQGLPILMEKPIERTLPAAIDIVDACEASGVPLGLVFQHRTRTVVAELRKQLAGLGPLALVEIYVPWWRAQSYYDEPGRGTLAKDGGGVLMTQAIHTLDLALSLTGPVKRASAMARTTALHQMEAEDFVSAGLEFSNGAVGSLTATTAHYPGGTERIVLHGPDGVAELAGHVLTVTRRGEPPLVFGAAGATGGGADPMAFSHAGHGAVIADFAQSLDEGRAPLVTGREGLRVHALIEALMRSSAQGTRVEVADV